MSSKTPRRDMEEWWSLDRVPDVGSWWKFYRSFIKMLPFIWPKLQVHQEPPCPPRLQKETWRKGGVLTGLLIWDVHQDKTWNRWQLLRGFLMLDLAENFIEASYRCSHSSDQNSGSIRNLHVLQASGRDMEKSWTLEGPWCCILMKFHRSFMKMLQDYRKRHGGKMESWLKPQVYHEPPYPPRLQEETWLGVWICFINFDLNETFTEKILPYECLPILQNETNKM